MPLWFEQGDYPAKIALFNELRSRNEGIWQFVRDADGVEGILCGALIISGRVVVVCLTAGGKEQEDDKRPGHQVRWDGSHGSFFHAERGKLPDGWGGRLASR